MILCLSGLLLLCSFFFKYYFRILFALVAGFLIGLLRIGQVTADERVCFSYIGKNVNLSATVSDIPETKKGQTRLKLNDLSYNYNTSSLKCQIYATMAGKIDSIKRSDRISIKAKLQTGFGEYIASIYHPQLVAIDKPDPPDFSMQIREVFTHRVREAFNDSGSADLALGFLIGEKTLTSDFKEKLKIVGLSHIVVASGYCLSVLVNFAKK